MTSSAVAAVETFLVLIRLLHRWVIKICPCRFSVGASWYPLTPATTRRLYIGLAVDRLCTGIERRLYIGLAVDRLCTGRERRLYIGLAVGYVLAGRD